MPIKIIHFISSLRRAGRERQMFTIYKHSDRDKYKVKILYFNDVTPNYLDEFVVKEGELIKIQSTSNFKRILEVIKILRSEKPDLVYSWGWLESLYSLIAKPLCGFAFINGSVRSGKVERKFWHYYRTILLHLSKNIVANSKAGLKANFLNRGLVLYNGIDQRFFGTLKLGSEAKEIRSSTKNPILISVANLVPFKDYFTVFDSLKILKNQGFRFLYLILGEGKMKAELMARITDLGMDDEIRILGSRINVEEFLSVSDIFIHSSRGEGCSNAILEAMAMGLPIIATNVGGTPEIVSSENGFLFDYKNSSQLVEKLAILLKDESQHKKMSKHSQRLAKDKYSIESMMANYYTILGKILKDRNV